MNFRQGNSRREQQAPDLTPLIDVVFLLLIFFLVTAAFTRDDDQLLPVDLPTAGTADEATAEGARVHITLLDDGSIALRLPQEDEDVTIDRAQLRAPLEELHTDEPNATIYLRGDEGAPYGVYISVLDLLRDIGFPRVHSVVGAPRAP